MSNLNFITTDCDDLACHTGVTFECDLLFQEDCSDVPQDLTGYTCELKIYDTVETNVIDTISADMAEADRGIVSFIIPASTTTNYTTGMYKHQINLSIGSNVYRVAQGYFEVSE